MLRWLSVMCLLPLSAFAAENAERGAALFLDNCAVCHGIEARGDGPMQMVLSVAPPDLTGLAAGNGGVFPLERVLLRIEGTDPLLAHGGPMPLYGGLMGGPSVALAPPGGPDFVVSEAIGDIVAWLRSVQE